jgi:hypothetical protein
MFTKEALSHYIRSSLQDPRHRESPHMYSTNAVTYSQTDDDIQVDIYREWTVSYQDGVLCKVDPILHWIDSMLLIRLEMMTCWACDTYRQLRDSDAFRRDTLVEAEKVSLCKPVPASEFYVVYHGLTEGCLPRGLDRYGTLTEAMHMEDEWHTQTYLARNHEWLVTFRWHTSV